MCCPKCLQAVCHHPADGELEKLCLYQLNTAARDFLAAGGQHASLAALALAGLSDASAATGLAPSASGSTGDEASAAGLGSQSGAGVGADAASSGTTSPRSTASLARAGDKPDGNAALGGAAAAASGRSGFMQRAFARPAAAIGGGGAGGDGAAGVAAAAHGGAASRASAFAVFQQRVREVNACVPYAGPQGTAVAGLLPWLRSWFAKRASGILTCCFFPSILHPAASWAPSRRQWPPPPPVVRLHPTLLPALSAGSRVDDVVITALLSHLPRQQGTGEDACKACTGGPPPHPPGAPPNTPPQTPHPTPTSRAPSTRRSVHACCSSAAGLA